MCDFVGGWPMKNVLISKTGDGSMGRTLIGVWRYVCITCLCICVCGGICVRAGGRFGIQRSTTVSYFHLLHNGPLISFSGLGLLEGVFSY